MSEIEFKELRIGVLGGGISSERDVSLISAQEALHALQRNNIDSVAIDITTREKESIKKQILQEKIDLAFIALHGEFGEDGGIQEILEELDIIYTGSLPFASFLAMNKILSKQAFLKKGIPTPAFSIWDDKKTLQDRLFPLVVKPACAGSSFGVSIVREKKDFDTALHKANAFQSDVIVEDYIAGQELTVGILDENALAVIEIIPKKGYFDFNAKYSDGMVEFIAPARLEKNIYSDVQRIALKAHKVLGCRHFSRVDVRLSKENVPYVLEVNSIPGLTSHSLLPLSAKCCGIKFDELILRMISLAYNAQKEAKQKS